MLYVEMPNIRVLKNNLNDEIRNLSIDFDGFSDTDKLFFILSNPLIAKASAKTCDLISERRRTLLYH